MNTRPYAREIANRLSRDRPPAGSPLLFVAALRELASGNVPTIQELAQRIGRPAEHVVALLGHTPSIEFDDQGRLIGYGLTRRETPHSFEVEGLRLYTWCALDTLIFPAVLGKTAHVRSRCPHTGQRVTLTVTPTDVLALFPPETTVSLLLPAPVDDIRASLCRHVHFFISRHAGEIYLTKRPEAVMLSVNDAFAVALDIARQLTMGSEVRESE